MSILHLYNRYSLNPGFQYLLDKLRENGAQHLLADRSPVNFTGVQVLHAHSWMEDGKAALEIHEKACIPFVLTVRAEDLEQASGFSAWHHAKQILENADYVVFADPMVDRYLAEKLPTKLADTTYSHAVTIYDGLNPFWLQHLRGAKPVSLIQIRLLYIGNPETDRRIGNLLKAIEHLLHRNFDVRLTIVHTECETAELEHRKLRVFSKPFVNMLGKQTCEERLALYRSHDILAMPCDEGVGTNVYAEALSQGLPLVYAKEGVFDGIYREGEAGYAVNTRDVEDLENKILQISERYATIEQHLCDLQPLHAFNVDENYRKYIRIYSHFNKNNQLG